MRARVAWSTRHIGILEIRKEKFRLKAIPLQTVRPFILEEVVLASENVEPNNQEAIVQLLVDKVEQMIAKALADADPAKDPPKPLVRLKVEYTGYSTINPQRFGQRFVTRVANPNDILLFYKTRKTSSKSAQFLSFIPFGSPSLSLSFCVRARFSPKAAKQRMCWTRI